jgi:hypothetical protein
MRIRCIHPVNLLQLPWTQTLTLVQTSDFLQRPLPLQHFVEARDAPAKPIYLIKMHRFAQDLHTAVASIISLKETRGHPNPSYHQLASNNLANSSSSPTISTLSPKRSPNTFANSRIDNRSIPVTFRATAGFSTRPKHSL